MAVVKIDVAADAGGAEIDRIVGRIGTRLGVHAGDEGRLGVDDGIWRCRLALPGLRPATPASHSF